MCVCMWKRETEMETERDGETVREEERAILWLLLEVLWQHPLKNWTAQLGLCANTQTLPTFLLGKSSQRFIPGLCTILAILITHFLCPKSWCHLWLQPSLHTHFIIHQQMLSFLLQINPALSVRYQYCNQDEFPTSHNGFMPMQENIVEFRRYMME